MQTHHFWIRTAAGILACCILFSAIPVNAADVDGAVSQMQTLFAAMIP